MCQFKSGIIFKNRIELAPVYNDSHSALLESLNIEDNRFNAEKVFVRAELLPPDGNFDVPVSKWKFSVDQDIVPDWFSEDRGKYEEEFRKVVSDWFESITKVVCGRRWFVLKEENGMTYCLLASSLDCITFSDNNNNYKDSNVRDCLLNSSLLSELKEELKDKIIPISMSLTSLNGSREYGEIEEDLISLLNLDLYRECAEKIPNFDTRWWLATPYSTPKKGGWPSGVCCVSVGGCVYCDDCGYCGGVRPFCIFKSSIF